MKKNTHIDIYRECITEKSFRRIIKNELEKSGAMYDKFDYDNVVKHSLLKKVRSSWTVYEAEKIYSIDGNKYWIDFEDYLHEYEDGNVYYYFSYYFHPIYNEACFSLDIEYK